MVDFRVLYYPARCLLHHGDPYNANQLLRMTIADSGNEPDSETKAREVMRYIYFPNTFTLTLPFALLPWGPAHLLWMALIVCSLLFASFLIWNLASEYAPAIVGCIWALSYYWPRRKKWNWSENGSLLIVVSVFVAPYAWLYDQVLVLPAIVHGAYKTKSRGALIVLALLTALVEVALMAIILKPAALYIWTLWSAPAWLVWYILATLKCKPIQPAATS